MRRLRLRARARRYLAPRVFQLSAQHLILRGEEIVRDYECAHCGVYTYKDVRDKGRRDKGRRDKGRRSLSVKAV